MKERESELKFREDEMMIKRKNRKAGAIYAAEQARLDQKLRQHELDKKS